MSTITDPTICRHCHKPRTAETLEDHVSMLGDPTGSTSHDHAECVTMPEPWYVQ